MQWVISNIEPTDTELQTYRVSIKELAEIIGITNKDFYDRMRQTTKKVMGRVIEIEEGEQLLQIPLINRAVYHKRSGTVDVRIDEDLKQYLLQLRDNFTSVRLKYVFRLASTYSIRIYELLVQYQQVRRRTVTVGDLRRMLDIDPEKYSLWADFERRVLGAAVKEINEKTDLKCRYKKVKQGRNITEIEFTFRSKEREAAAELMRSTMPDEYIRLVEHGVSERDAVTWTGKYTSEALRQAIGALEAAQERGGAIKSPGGWLRRALESGWQDSELEERRVQAIKEKERQRAKAAQERAEDLRAAQKQAYNAYRRNLVREFLESLPAAEEAELRAELEQVASNQLFFVKKSIQFADRDAWYSPMVFMAGVDLLARRKGLRVKDEETFLEEDYQPAHRVHK